MASKAAQQPIDTRQFRSSLRLIFSFDGEHIELVEAVRVAKIAPGTSPEAPRKGEHRGAWLELVDSEGRTLFHRLLHDPLQTRAEHHSPDGIIEVHYRAPQPCQFWALVPDIPGGSEIILYSSPVETKRMGEAASEIGRFRLPGDKPRGDERRGDER